MKNDYATRILCERDRERNAADLLAVAVKQSLVMAHDGEAGALLAKALLQYCTGVGYNGPAGSWAKWLLSKEIPTSKKE